MYMRKKQFKDCVFRGDRHTIKAHSTAIIKHADLGDNVRIYEFALIGFEGFQYIRQADGTLISLGHTGRCFIGNNVSIHQHSSVGRGIREYEEINGKIYRNTVIMDNSKIDSYVQVGHGVIIHESTLVCAGVIIGGHSEIGSQCYIGEGANIRNRIKIGDNVMIGMGSNVVSDIPDNVVVWGNPARVMRDNKFH